MSSPVAIIGLAYDATDLQESSLDIFLTITYGLNESYEVRGKDVLVPGADGMVPRPRRPHSHKILLAGHVRGSGADQAAQRADYRTNMRTLRTVFDPARSPADLVAELEDGSTWTITARPVSPGILAAERIPSEWADVSIELLSVAPDWTVEEAGS